MWSEGFPMGAWYGPPLTLVGSVLWARVLYVVYGWHELGARLRAHTSGS